MKLAKQLLLQGSRGVGENDENKKDLVATSNNKCSKIKSLLEKNFGAAKQPSEASGKMYNASLIIMFIFFYHKQSLTDGP